MNVNRRPEVQVPAHVDVDVQAPAPASIGDSDAVLRMVLDEHTDGIVIVVDGRVAYVNPAQCRLVGYDASELLQTSSAIALIAPHDQDRASKRLQALLTGADSEPGTYACIRRDGTTVLVEVASSHRIRYGGQPALLTTLRNRTQSDRAHDALLEAEAKYRCLVEHSLVGVFLVQNERVMYVNPTMEEMFGYNQQEMLALPSFLTLVADEDRETVAGRVTKRLNGEVGRTRTISRGRRKDGQIIAVEVHAARTTYSGQPALIGTMLDVTDRLELETQLRATARMESVGELAAGVAHNFNNALMAIAGYADLIADRLPADDPARQDLDQIQQVTERGASLTRQLLAFSRKEQIHPSVFCLNTAVESACGLLAPLLGDQCELRLTLDRDLPTISGDRAQIEQVVSNLVLNARDAMPTGGVVTLATETLDLDAAALLLHPEATPGGHVRLLVTDTGSGMDPETAARVFEPFFTTKDPGAGVGLGLAMVHGTITHHGGFVDLTSEPDVGSSFSVYLPAPG